MTQQRRAVADNRKNLEVTFKDAEKTPSEETRFNNCSNNNSLKAVETEQRNVPQSSLHRCGRFIYTVQLTANKGGLGGGMKEIRRLCWG